ncbi:hypothetical protein SAMD00019534_084650 [Acytostelium subglobosum LB1]|uniref:hypothetical protein n=1 Tax=Acytostelium subglobosum LB1 TaxID=1410327 RepID=UPI0006447B6C|nr:hypothetical protein SAMD00019534_084650 [Acytostelium subglobosum LB1]GAM25290.1 hypothetical protein SAMD00019534_084650 [Acytostelium subglobosum LB1]|eukprot:XP_012751810.1 hypothetical protein SAMD00019534_084650 [Acytostelium subglobosum LB1]
MSMTPGGKSFEYSANDNDGDNANGNDGGNNEAAETLEFSFDFQTPSKTLPQQQQQYNTSSSVDSIDLTMTPMKTPQRPIQTTRSASRSHSKSTCTYLLQRLTPSYPHVPRSPLPHMSPFRNGSPMGGFGSPYNDGGTLHWSPSPYHRRSSPSPSPFKHHHISPARMTSPPPPSTHTPSYLRDWEPSQSPFKPIVPVSKSILSPKRKQIDTSIAINESSARVKRKRIDFSRDAPAPATAPAPNPTLTATLPTTTSQPKVNNKPIPKMKDVICVVDNREVKSVSERDYIGKRLCELGVSASTRKLELGDFAWVAVDYAGNEYMLDFIIERKRVDDLSSSIMDGRYKEQKFRLAKCGCGNKYYLVEGDVKSLSSSNVRNGKSWGTVNYGLPADTLSAAMVSTHVNDNIIVIETKDMESSITFIQRMSGFIRDKVMSGNSISNNTNNIVARMMYFPPKTTNDSSASQHCDLDTFNKLNQKTKDIGLGELFAIQIMQIGGCTADRAAAIVALYPTPLALILAYAKLKDQQAKKTMLSNIRFGKQNKKIGNAISELICSVYCDTVYKSSSSAPEEEEDEE